MSRIQHKIVPHLWFDTEAKEAARFYCSIFPDSEVTSITKLHDTPSGNCDIVSFTLFGQPFMAISAGPFLNLMNPFHLWSTAIRKKKLIAIGKCFLQFLKRSSVAG
jgi:predicted 3-demethylubiquinone-9 3-methyltransferase (glyoxalase superfamily)